MQSRSRRLAGTAAQIRRDAPQRRLVRLHQLEPRHDDIKEPVARALRVAGRSRPTEHLGVDLCLEGAEDVGLARELAPEIGEAEIGGLGDVGEADVAPVIDFLIDHFFPIALCHALEFQDLPAARCGKGKLELDPLGVALDLNHLDLLKLLDARLDLAGFVRLVAEPVHKCLDSGDFFRLPPRGSHSLAISFCADLFERGIVASIFFDSMVPEIPDMGDNTIEKRRVVADEQQRHLRVQEELLEPALRRFIQVVGRLVEQQDVRVGQKQMRQRHAHSIATGQFLDRTTEIDLRKSQPHQDAFRFMFGIQIAMGGVQHGLARNSFEFLREVADAETRTLADGSLVRRFLPKDHPEERGLAGAVGSHQADP